MKKSDVVREIAKRTDFVQADVRRVVNELFKVINENVIYEDIEIKDFGVVKFVPVRSELFRPFLIKKYTTENPDFKPEDLVIRPKGKMILKQPYAKRIYLDTIVPRKKP